MKSAWHGVLVAVLVAMCSAASSGGAAPKFAAGPTATRDGSATKIAFTVDAPTDVEVSILDAEGNVVRHLAAGLLGDNPPVPLKNGLSQELTWDGLDDDGKAASAARVRIRLGMQARFERIIGWSGQSIDAARGLVCGPDGKLYVTHGLNDVSIHRETTLITAHERDGTYSHQVFPGPANLPPEKRKGWPRIEPADGPEQPVMFALMARSTYPGAVYGQRSSQVVTRDGRIIALSSLHSFRLKRPDGLAGGARASATWFGACRWTARRSPRC